MFLIKEKLLWKSCAARDILSLLSRAAPQWHLGKHQIRCKSVIISSFQRSLNGPFLAVIDSWPRSLALSPRTSGRLPAGFHACASRRLSW
jgi:hypothetical protein